MDAVATPGKVIWPQDTVRPSSAPVAPRGPLTCFVGGKSVGGRNNLFDVITQSCSQRIRTDIRDSAPPFQQRRQRQREEEQGGGGDGRKEERRRRPSGEQHHSQAMTSTTRKASRRRTGPTGSGTMPSERTEVRRTRRWLRPPARDAREEPRGPGPQ